MASLNSKTDRQICGNLRTRANYIPGLQVSNSNYNPNDYTPCFCLKTLHVIGPDDRPVSQEDCNDRRRCFEPLGGIMA
jgi:hypothetical protein